MNGLRGERLTGERIRRIIGRADDQVVAEILGLGATEEQVLEAFERVQGNTASSEAFGRPADTVVGLMVEILSRDEPPADID